MIKSLEGSVKGAWFVVTQHYDGTICGPIGRLGYYVSGDYVHAERGFWTEEDAEKFLEYKRYTTRLDIVDHLVVAWIQDGICLIPKVKNIHEAKEHAWKDFYKGRKDRIYFKEYFEEQRTKYLEQNYNPKERRKVESVLEVLRQLSHMEYEREHKKWITKYYHAHPDQLEWCMKNGYNPDEDLDYNSTKIA